MQLSKNWHGGNKDIAEWAGYNGRWWIASSLLRLPPNSKIDLTLAVNYELYGGVPAWSHAQLSVAGKGGFWLWEQAALGSSGENMCFDPLGTATRAFITDVRPKLFDGKWKNNVGGGDIGPLLFAARLMPPRLQWYFLSRLWVAGIRHAERLYTRVAEGGAKQRFTNTKKPPGGGGAG